MAKEGFFERETRRMVEMIGYFGEWPAAVSSASLLQARAEQLVSEMIAG